MLVVPCTVCGGLMLWLAEDIFGLKHRDPVAWWRWCNEICAGCVA